MEEHNKNIRDITYLAELIPASWRGLIRDITYLAELIPASWRGLIRAITYSPPSAVRKLCAH